MIARPFVWMRCAASGALLLMTAGVAWPQAAPAPQSLPPQQPPPVLQAAPEPPQSSAPNRPGFVDEIGKFFQDPPWGLPPLKTPQQTLEDLNIRTKDATDNLTRFSKGQVVAGRIKCPVAANGAPDCKVAATKLCTDKGYKEGQSLDSDSAESCPASVLLSGKKDDVNECRVENFVIRALCQ